MKQEDKNIEELEELNSPSQENKNINKDEIKEDIESIQRKIDEENKEYEEKRLVKISELQRRKTPFSDFYTSTVFFFTLFAFIFFGFFTMKQNPINTALKFKDMKVSYKTYDILKDNLENMNKKLSEEELKVFTTDILILSNYAKENGITINDNDISEVEKLGFSVLKEEIALSKKLKESFQEEIKSFTEEDYKKHYEETKDPYYRENGTISYYYFHSDKDLHEDSPLDKSKLDLKSGTLEELNLGGITNFTEDIIQYLWANEDGTNQYIYIEDSNINYHPYENVKEEVIKHLEYITVDGKISDITFEAKERTPIQTFDKK